jgi:transcriptional regulator with XRE-family HTH domain
MDLLNEKIRQIIEECKLTPSKFADEIGVQRSSISHIMAGRNKPSFDIIAKINRWDPSYSLDFFMEGEEYQNSTPSVQPSLFSSEVPYAQRTRENTVNKPLIGPNKEQNADRRQQSDDSGKKIERVLVFYTDKTISEYIPNM